MNKTYRLIWNELTRCWVPVSEIARARGKKASARVLLAALLPGLLTPPAALAAPVGPPSPVSVQTLPSGVQYRVIQAGTGAPIILAGAHGVAVVSAICGQADVTAATRQLRQEIGHARLSPS